MSEPEPNVFARYAKAVAGAIVAGLSTLQVALLSPGVTALEWVLVAIAVVSTAGGVAVTTNAK